MGIFRGVFNEIGGLPPVSLGTPEATRVGLIGEEREEYLAFLHSCTTQPQEVPPAPNQRHEQLLEVIRAHNWPAPMPKVTPIE